MRPLPWVVAAAALGVALVLALFPIRVDRDPVVPAPYMLPAVPDAGDLLQAFSPLAVRRSDGVCFDYGDRGSWVARVCYPDASPPHPMGRPLVS